MTPSLTCNCFPLFLKPSLLKAGESRVTNLLKSKEEELHRVSNQKCLWPTYPLTFSVSWCTGSHERCVCSSLPLHSWNMRRSMLRKSRKLSRESQYGTSKRFWLRISHECPNPHHRSIVMRAGTIDFIGHATYLLLALHLNLITYHRSLPSRTHAVFILRAFRSCSVTQCS